MQSTWWSDFFSCTNALPHVRTWTQTAVYVSDLTPQRKMIPSSVIWNSNVTPQFFFYVFMNCAFPLSWCLQLDSPGVWAVVIQSQAVVLPAWTPQFCPSSVSRNFFTFDVHREWEEKQSLPEDGPETQTIPSPGHISGQSKLWCQYTLVLRNRQLKNEMVMPDNDLEQYGDHTNNLSNLYLWIEVTDTNIAMWIWTF